MNPTGSASRSARGLDAEVDGPCAASHQRCLGAIPDACTDTSYRSPGSERAGWRAFETRVKPELQVRLHQNQPARRHRGAEQDAASSGPDIGGGLSADFDGGRNYNSGCARSGKGAPSSALRTRGRGCLWTPIGRSKAGWRGPGDKPTNPAESLHRLRCILRLHANRSLQARSVQNALRASPFVG